MIDYLSLKYPDLINDFRNQGSMIAIELMKSGDPKKAISAFTHRKTARNTHGTMEIA